MKVVHVLAELNPSGAERMLACSLSSWRSAGIEPIIVGMAEGANPFAATLSEAGYQVRLLPGVRSAKGLATLWRTLRVLRPRIVHLHNESCFDAAALLAASSPGVEGIVRTVHNNFCFTGSLRARRRIRVAFARRIGVVWIACSDDVAATERSYSRRHPIPVIENWADGDRIMREATDDAAMSIRRDRGIPPEAPTLALIANCNIAKNHELIARTLHDIATPTHVLHVGSRRDEPETEKQAWHNLPARHTVHHLGQRNDVPALLATSDLLLIPSLREGMPLIAIEALFARVPMLVADALGLRWLKTFPSTTLLPLESRAWVTAITVALADRPRQAAVQASFVAARTRFTPQRGVAEYVQAYGEALQTRPFRRSRYQPGPRAESGA